MCSTSMYHRHLHVQISLHKKSCGDGGVAPYTDLTSRKCIVTILHIGGFKLILTSLLVLFGQELTWVELIATKQPYLGITLLTQCSGRV